jgi:hypothetical protein
MTIRLPIELARAIVGGALALVVAGCGYSNGVGSAASFDTSESAMPVKATPRGYQWKSLYRPGIETVAVDIFESKEFRRGDEFGLTTAIAKQIEATTPYKIAPRDRADTLLEGSVRSIHRPVMSLSRNGGVPQEQFYELTVDFVWKDLRNGKILTSRTYFDQTTAYYPTLGEDAFVGQQSAAERLALAIVQQMEADW